MLKLSRKHRPRQLLAVYIEPQQVEILQAHRQWRAWQIDSTERFPVAEGDSLYDHLQRLNLRSRVRKGTALVVFLPRTAYGFHSEHYPATLQDQLEEALHFDWQENIFHEETLHFFGSAVPVDHHLSVPIFSLQQDQYDKLYQVLNAPSFQTFTVLPSALSYQAFLSPASSGEESPPLQTFGRLLDSDHLEVHRFYKGHFLDSVVMGRHSDHLRLFLENLHAGGNGTGTEGAPIELLCTEEEWTPDYAQEWGKEDVPIHIHMVKGSLLSHWVQHLLQQDQIQTFDHPLLLKPWNVPKVVWPLAILMALYLAFAGYEVHSFNKLEESSRRLKRQTAQLETQWKPIEQLQTRIAKFQEDQKTLSEFNLEGYPLVELLTMLTQMTPDDTWLNYLSLRKGQLILRGESKSAIKYLSEISKTEGFGDVRFASPVTRNPASDQERFNVQLQIDLDKFKKTTDALASEPGEEPPEPARDAVVQTPQPAKAAREPVVQTPQDDEDPEDTVVEPPEEEGADEEVGDDEGLQIEDENGLDAESEVEE